MLQKEIIYLGLYKDGNRLGSAGFLRVEKREQTGSMSLQIKNAPPSISGKFPVRYYCGEDWKETDGITLQDGRGRWEKQVQSPLEQVQLQIMLPGGYLVEGMSKAQAEKPVALKNETESGEASAMQEGATERDRESESTENVAEERTRERRAETVERISVQRESITQNTPEEETAQTDDIVQAALTERANPPLMADRIAMENLKEDKWEQILDTYDRIHPYGDARVYVKLQPKDFIILSAKYQHLVNNSFLLHGFYNYRHVILGKEKDAYYLGVPGVFYEREKMVALMFGFEAFECESGNPGPGVFGYYLRKVEL